jgi:hypothetical protein
MLVFKQLFTFLSVLFHWKLQILEIILFIFSLFDLCQLEPDFRLGSDSRRSAHLLQHQDILGRQVNGPKPDTQARDHIGHLINLICC